MESKDKMLITGGNPLVGEITVSGGKNTAVAVIPAALLCNEPCTIENLPDIEDVRALVDILRELGAEVDYRPGQRMVVNAANVKEYHVPYRQTRRLRASYYLLGALLGRGGRAEVAYPGGCNIGSRPIDQHLKGFETLGPPSRIGAAWYTPGQIIWWATTYSSIWSLSAAPSTCCWPPTVTISKNTMIYNAAKEPHIVDLANFLNSMGAKIRGAGTDVIRVRGVQNLHGTSYTVIPDQIETGTLMIAAAATRGDVVIHGCIPTHMEALTAKLLEMGVRVTENDDSIRVRPQGVQRAVNVKTQVYPGFPTDLQQPMTSLLCMANGVSTVSETIFERRFMHLDELRRMGAHIKLMDHSTILIEGVRELYGAPVTVTDLRAGAALIVAGLMAKGVTEIYETSYIDRGYERIEEKLRSLGADIRREKLS